MGDDVVSFGILGMASAYLGRYRVSRERLGAQSPAHYSATYDLGTPRYGCVRATLPLLAPAEARALSFLEIFRDALSMGLVALRRVSLGLPRARLADTAPFRQILRRILGHGKSAEEVIREQ